MDLASEPIIVTSHAEASKARREIHAFAAAVIGLDSADDVALMVSEGIANAVRHGRGNPVITVACVEKTLRVQVHDDGPGLIIARQVDHGRGLGIIDDLASRWTLVTDDTGTCLTFEVDRKADE